MHELFSEAWTKWWRIIGSKWTNNLNFSFRAAKRQIKALALPTAFVLYKLPILLLVLNQVDHNKRNTNTTKQVFLNWGKYSILEPKHCNIQSVQKLNREAMLWNVADFIWRKTIWYGLHKVVVFQSFETRCSIVQTTNRTCYVSVSAVWACILMVVVMILVVTSLAWRWFCDETVFYTF